MARWWITALLLLSTAAAAEVPADDPPPIKRLDDAAALSGLAIRMEALAEVDQFSGAFLVARHDKVLLQQAHGLATRVTVRHLLTHTGGTGGLDNLEPDYAGDRAALRTHADYLELQSDRPPAFPPGSKVDYSNYGFMLLGAIIENVTGRDYYEVVREKLFLPAGMDSTGAEPESTAVPLRATAYHSKGGAWVDAASTLPWRGTAAGGGYTTVGDLLKFAQALQAGKLLSPAMLAQATSPQRQEGWYGFGFITVGAGPLRRYGHGGDADGMNADFRVFPESGWVLISLSNIDPPAAYRLGRWFEPRMPIDAAPAPSNR